jgi:hypothetical protein
VVSKRARSDRRSIAAASASGRCVHVRRCGSVPVRC